MTTQDPNMPYPGPPAYPGQFDPNQPAQPTGADPTGAAGQSPYSPQPDPQTQLADPNQGGYPPADGTGAVYGQTPAQIDPNQKKGSILPWILVMILLVTTIGGVAWGVISTSSASKKQKEVTSTQAKVDQLSKEISTLQTQLDKTKGTTTEQAATLKNAKALAIQMNDQAIVAVKEMNGVIVEFNNVIARFNARDTAGANAAIEVANQHITQMKAALQKYDELSAQFDKAVSNVS